jgi:hypothetical protein
LAILGAHFARAQPDTRAISHIVYSEEDACNVGDLMIARGDLYHCTKEHAFENQPLFYQFTADAPNHGKKGVVPTTGEELGWKHLAEGTCSVRISCNYRVEIKRACYLDRSFVLYIYKGIFPAARASTLQTSLAGIASREAAMEQATLDIEVSPLDKASKTALFACVRKIHEEHCRNSTRCYVVSVHAYSTT